MRYWDRKNTFKKSDWPYVLSAALTAVTFFLAGAPTCAYAVDLDTMAGAMARSSIQAQLRDPDSLHMIGLTIVHFRKTPLFVCSNFRAKNGFGGYDVDYAIVDLVDSKDKWHAIVRFSPSQKEWRRICEEFEQNPPAWLSK